MNCLKDFSQRVASRAAIRASAILTAALVLASCQATTGNRVSVDYYQITGNSTAALDADIRRKGPRLDAGRHAVAIARIKMTPNVQFKRTDGLCEVSKAKVAVDAKVTLPAWKGRADANKELGRAWDNIDRYTRLHEATHVNIAFSYAKRIEDEVLALPSMASCSQVRSTTKAIVDRNLDEHDAAQRKYDADEQARFSMLAKRTKITESL